MKEQIKKIIFSRNDVSFPELMKAIPESAGDRTMFHNNESLILWEGMSQQFVAALEALLHEGSIELERVGVTDIVATHAYTRDRPLGYPLAKRIKNYKTPHWIPSIIRVRRK